MAKTKFPKVIHVVWEEPGNDEPYLAVREDGVMSVENTQPMAIYKLVEVGRATVTRKFEKK